TLASLFSTLSSSKTFDFIESLFVIFLESAFLLGNAYFNAERLQAGFILGLRPRKDAFSRWPRSKNSTPRQTPKTLFSATEKAVGWDSIKGKSWKEVGEGWRGRGKRGGAPSSERFSRPSNL
ncbi:hypothetical protein, partial [Bilophila wadsworthia]|uniref:hypothetical protein n=1 Tax=Bilophila wadsworthia TaxID=35833 RepID=UPI003AB398F2